MRWQQQNQCRSCQCKTITLIINSDEQSIWMYIRLDLFQNITVLHLILLMLNINNKKEVRMNSKPTLSVDELNLSKQLKQYGQTLQQTILDLTSACNYSRLSGSNSWAVRQLQVMNHKLQLEIQQYAQVITKIEDKVMSGGALKSFRKYFAANFRDLVRESCQLLSMCGNQVKLPKDQDYQRVKQLQEELDNQWECSGVQQRKNISYQHRSNTIAENISLESRANAQIQQQFLAIRLIAYKMYEKYNGHEHSNLHEEIRTLAEEQARLSKQITEMKEVRMELTREERKLQQQLKQIKKINELVGRRYFVLDENAVDTNFTTY